MSIILDIPTEVLLYIIDFIEWRYILRLTETCKFLHNLVKTTSSLQYPITLGVSGLLDPLQSSQGSSSRLTQLNTFQNAWRNLAFRNIRTVQLPSAHDGWTYELQSGFFALTMLHQAVWAPTTGGKSDLLLVNLRTGEHWRDEIDVEVQDFSFDPGQDLAVMFQWMGVDPERPEARVHLRQLSTLKPHPLAEQPIITYDLKWSHPPLGWNIHSIQIAGDLVGVLFDPRSFSEGDRIALWNWRTGVLVAELPATRLIGLDSFALLSPQVFIVSDARQPSINVFRLVEGQIRPVHCKCFVLPRLGADRRMERIIVRSDPVASAGLPSTAQPRSTASDSQEYESAPSSESEGSRTNDKLRPAPTYRTAPGARLLCFVIRIWKFDADVVNTAHLFTPLSTFVRPDLASDPASIDTANAPNGSGVTYVPWKDWGPQNTRFVVDGQLNMNPFVTFIHGQRFVMGSRRVDEPANEGEEGQVGPLLGGLGVGGGRGRWIKVYDFNQLSIRRDLHSRQQQSNDGGKQFHEGEDDHRPAAKEDGDIHVEPSTVPRADFFGTADVVTSLPYRVSEQRLEATYSALMMDGEHVVAVGQLREGDQAMDVLHIHQIDGAE